MKFYTYPKCSTCKRAEKFLSERGITVEVIDIKDKPPSVKELKQMLQALGEKRKLFNTSGMLYRERGLKEKLPEMSEQEALKMLSEEGMLVKRPFLLGDGVALVGFKEAAWEEALALVTQ